MIKFGIIKETKNPLDRRVVFGPNELKRFHEMYPDVIIRVQSATNRIYSDHEYAKAGFEVSDNINDCDVFLGVKEVAIDHLIPQKSYFFFSHTIKKQPHNRPLLQALLDKKITFYDHETIVNENNERLIGFGKYAGFVGAYNSLRAFGLKFELFKLPKAENLQGKPAMIAQAKRVVLPPIKLVNTGTGKVGLGIKEFLDAIKVKQVSPENYLTKNYTQPVYTQIDVLDYAIRKDGKREDCEDFFLNPSQYESHFERFTKVSDIFIAGHYQAINAPMILTSQMLNDKNCKIKVVVDVSCDGNNSIASTLRTSTIDQPFYGYLPNENKEVDFFHPAAVVVMAIDNLPSEIPLESSVGFGEMFLEKVIPAFFNGDKEHILDRAKITQNGQLTKRFNYLQKYVEGIE